MTATSIAARHATHSLPVFVLSDRLLLRDLLVEHLRRGGFALAKGRVRASAVLRALAPSASALVFVDVGSEKEDPETVIARFSAERPNVTTVALGRALQLAARARDAGGWIAMSQRAHRVRAIAAEVSRLPRGSVRPRACPEVERLFTMWRTLTGRQRQVLALLGSGVDNHRLAVALGISERAAKAHVSALLQKFNADSRTELALIAARAQLRSPMVEFPFNL